MIVKNQAIILYTLRLHMLNINNISTGWKKLLWNSLERMDKQDLCNDVTLKQRPDEHMSHGAQHSMLEWECKSKNCKG